MTFETFKFFTKKATMLVASAALAAAVVPATALATNANDPDAPDNVIVVNWTEGGAARSATVDLDDLDADDTIIGAQFYKNVWNVIKSDEYVYLSDVLDEATSGTYTASDVWGTGKQITFEAWNYKNGTWSSSPYSKFNEFTYDNLTAATGFYGNASPTILGAVTDASMYDEPVIALSSVTVAEDAADSGLATALSVLNNTSVTTNGTDSPRFLWGYMDANHQGGNRFPSNIESITISDVAQAGGSCLGALGDGCTARLPKHADGRCRIR